MSDHMIDAHVKTYWRHNVKLLSLGKGTRKLHVKI